MDIFVRKKRAWTSLWVAWRGSGAGIATHEPEAETEAGPTERSDASEPLSSAYSLLYFNSP